MPVPATAVSIRPATAEDAAAVNEIFNYYVVNSTCAFRERPMTLEERLTYLSEHDEAHPVVIAEEDGVPVGWSALSAHRNRCVYPKTVEDSVYVRHDRRGRGVGRAMLAHLLERAPALGHHTVLALIEPNQEASLALHAKMGFVEAGRLREVGFKFGRWLDLIYMQRMLGMERLYSHERPHDTAPSADKAVVG